jgi:hypothetical protein
METAPTSDQLPTAKELLDKAIAEGRLPDVATLGPPAGSNADWDELLTGESVELSIIRNSPLNHVNGSKPAEEENDPRAGHQE